MKTVSLVMLIILGCFVLWLTIDTTIYVVKRIKQRKKAKKVHFENTEEKEEEII